MYSISELSKLSGTSIRALRHYEEIGLLNPKRAENGYRIYDSEDVDRLQLILYYRELGFKLITIKEQIEAENFNPEITLIGHLNELIVKRNHLDSLIKNVKTTLNSIRGEVTMSDKEKFEAFKRNLVEENERKYGNEVREMYGEESTNYANEKILNMTEKEKNDIEELSKQLNDTLKKAAEIGDPNTELAKETVKLHRDWMSFFMDGVCDEAQIAMSEMYVNDNRFKAYYDNIFPGSAEFLLEAVKNYYSGE